MDVQLLDAVGKGDVEGVNKALAGGANVNCIDAKTGDTPLIVASHKSSGDNEANEVAHHFSTIITTLIKAGANVNATNNDGATAFYNACWNKNVEMALMLIKAGANVNASDHEGWTPLYDACHNEHVELVDILLRAGANVNAANNEGDRPIMVASKKGNVDLVTTLIKHGANINLANNEGWTSLIYAAYKGHSGVVRALLDAGANKNMATVTEYEDVPANKDAAQVAAIAGNGDIIGLIKGPIYRIPIFGPVLSVVVRPFINAFREH